MARTVFLQNLRTEELLAVVLLVSRYISSISLFLSSISCIGCMSLRLHSRTKRFLCSLWPPQLF